MEVFIQVLSNPAEMSKSQWLLVAILVFVMTGAAYLVWRLYKLITDSKKSPYVPNIGRKRLAMSKTDKSGADGN